RRADAQGDRRGHGGLDLAGQPASCGRGAQASQRAPRRPARAGVGKSFDARRTPGGTEALAQPAAPGAWARARPDARTAGRGGAVGRVDEVLPQSIPERDWDLVLVSVEAEGPSPTAPSNRHSIAGRVTLPAASQGQPSELPRTGGPPTLPADAPSTRYIPLMV